MKKLLLSSLFAVLSISFLYAQSDAVKFGKIDIEDLEMTTYPEDPEASAVVLYDYGYARFNYRGSDGITIRFERHVRVKILKRAGLSHADMEIPLYKEGEKLMGSIKGVTYNLVNGKVQEDQLDKKQVFT